MIKAIKWYLRKKNKNWTDEMLQSKAQSIWDNYEKAHPERKEQLKKELDEAIEKDFLQFEFELLDEIIEKGDTNGGLV